MDFITPGTGGKSTTPLDDVAQLVVEAGGQGGHHFIFDVQVSGIIPGEPTNAQSRQNPRTRLSAYSSEGTELDRINCPSRLPYVEESDGEFSLLRPYILVLDEEQLDVVYGHEVLVVAEVVDAEGVYLRQEYAASVADREATSGPGLCVSCRLLQRLDEQVSGADTKYKY